MVCAHTEAGDWPQYLGPTRDGVAAPSSVVLATNWPAGGPPLRWATTAYGGYGGPSIFSNRVYFVDSQRLDEVEGEDGSGMRETLRCLDLADGAEQWRLDYDLSARTRAASVPAVSESHVSYITSQGHLVMVDAREGRLLWRKPLQDAEERGALRHAFAQSPLFVSNTVVVAAHNRTAGLVAYRRTDGAIVWQTPPFHELMGRGYERERHKWSSPAWVTLHGRAQIVHLVLDGAVSTDPFTGEVLWVHIGWRTPTKAPPVSVLPGNRLFLTQGYTGESQLIDIERAAQGDWSVAVVTNIAVKGTCHPAVAHNGYLYLNAHSRHERDDRGLVCLDRDGITRWQTRLKGQGTGFGDGGLLRSGDLLIAVSSRDCSLVLVRATPERYTELARAQVCSRPSGFSPLLAPPALSGGRLVLRCTSTIRCYDLAAGAAPVGDVSAPDLPPAPGGLAPVSTAGEEQCP